MNIERDEARVGDLVVAAFDVAEGVSSDPRTVTRLATRAVMRILRQVRRRRGVARPGGALGPRSGRGLQRAVMARLAERSAAHEPPRPDGVAR
jgi:hypothetical protein